MLRIGAWLNGDAHFAFEAGHAIDAAVHAFFLDDYHAFPKRLLQHGRIVVSAAMLIDEEADRLRFPVGMPVVRQQVAKGLAEHGTFAAPAIDNRIEPGRADEHTAD